MTVAWLERPRRQQPYAHLLARPFPRRWTPILAELPFHAALDRRGRRRLCEDLRVLIAHKQWVGRGLPITAEIQVVIAAQAALLLLNIDHEYFPNVTRIVVHPTSFEEIRDAPRLPLRRGSLGEACRDGTVHLAWDAARRGALDPHDGRNLVLHEFAHELDLEDGRADGAPPLPDAQWRAEWHHVLTAHLTQLRVAIADGHAPLLDRYGAGSRAELFAVATECFFERGRELAQQHPDLYLQLWRYYGQDPAACC